LRADSVGDSHVVGEVPAHARLARDLRVTCERPRARLANDLAIDLRSTCDQLAINLRSTCA
jgi:hypothetical protein